MKSERGHIEESNAGSVSREAFAEAFDGTRCAIKWKLTSVGCIIISRSLPLEAGRRAFHFPLFDGQEEIPRAFRICRSPERFQNLKGAQDL